MYTAAQICNLALTEIGNTAHIDSLDDPSEEGRLSKLFYSQCLSKVLEDGEWQFATRRAILAPVANDSRTNWDYVYQLPSDFLGLRALVLEGAELPPPEIREPFSIEASVDGKSKVLLCNIDVVEIKYVAYVTTTTMFSTGFIEALVVLLASKFAKGLKGDSKLGVSLEAQYEAKISIGAAKEKNQRELQRLEPTTPSLRARGGSSVFGTTE